MTPPRQEVLARVARLIDGLLPPAAGDRAIEEDTGLLGQGIGLDSVETLQLVAAAEEEFGITVRDDELMPEHFRTLGTFATFIEQRLE